MHIFDIGNPCLDYESSLRWSYRISQEFYDQYSAEEVNVGKGSPHLKPSGPTGVYKGTLFFVKFLCQPLLVKVVRQFPGLKQAEEQLVANAARLEEALQQ